MMKQKLYLAALSCMALFSSAQSFAQCPDGRYNTQLFSAITSDTATYSSVYGLKMNIYQPVGDTLAARPLIILAHGGSFVGGSKDDDSTVVKLCRNFAKRGYVTASIDYRLGNLVSMVSDSVYATNQVVKAISDGKAAMRFFVQDAATTNTYKIDTNNVFIGGNSAGAVLYMHVGYIDSIAECNASIAGAMAANGGFDGNSGNAGYSYKSKAVINLAGALNTSAFVGYSDKPSVNAQGDADIVVPYNCAHPNLGVPAPVTLCGLGALEPAYVAKNVYHMSYVFHGDSHVPWASNSAKFYTVDSLVTSFLFNLVCTNVAGVNEVSGFAETELFPNPASELVNIKATENMKEVMVYDQTGRVVHTQNNIGSRAYELNTAQFATGVYFVKIRFSNVNTTPVIKRVEVQQ